MANKIYTSQEMREAAENITRVDIMDGLSCREHCYQMKQMVRGMLRQAADMIECEKKREKKYEFSVKEFGGYVQPLHDDSLSSSFLDGRAVGDENYVIVRREVGVWEEVAK